MEVRFFLASLAIVNLVVCFSSIGKVSSAKYSVKVQKDVKIPMRDGVKLSADIYRPSEEGKFPALMLLRYYQTGANQAIYFAKRGYVVLLVYSRGRGGSEGEWNPYVNEPQDGYDAQNWIGKQSWCNGMIGMFCKSYNAFTQTMSAPKESQYLKCLFPIGGQQTNFGHLYNDGVPQLNVIFEFGLFSRGELKTQQVFDITHPHYRRLPLIAAVDDLPHSEEIQHVKDWLKHSKYDDYWKEYGIKEKYHKIKVPAYFVTGWYDNLVHETWRNFLGFQKKGGTEATRRGTKILVGPWRHGGAGDLRELKLRWYDYWLKGMDTGIDKEPPIKIYVMGKDEWRYENEWPLKRTKFTKFYLHSGGKANSLKGDGKLSTSSPAKDSPTDRFVYDPENPVYTLGGQISTHSKIWGPKDRSSVQEREDVLVYTTEPLAEDLEVTGPVKMKLYAASSASDTDFTATLTDVHPDGVAIHICEGIRRARFRESLENPTLIEPDKVYEYTISLWETSMVFKAGHRIRLEISSSNFPRYARNLNTGNSIGMSAEIKKAKQTIYHNLQYPSHLILPVIPQ